MTRLLYLLKDQNLINRIKKIFIVFLLILNSCKFSDYSIDGNWKIVNSQIFTTSNINEKEEFYKSCLNKNIVIKEDKIYFPQPDNCFDVKTDIQILKKKVCQMKELPINNLERLSTSLGWKNDSISKNKKIEYFEGILDSKKEENKILIFKVNASEIAIYQDPYFLILERK